MEAYRIHINLLKTILVESQHLGKFDLSVKIEYLNSQLIIFKY